MVKKESNITNFIGKILWKGEDKKPYTDYEYFKHKEKIKLNLHNTLAYDNFVQEKSCVIDSIDQENSKKIYEKKYEENIKEYKNEFWMDAKDIDSNLEKMFWPDNVGDGTFLYSWKIDEENNGIVTYIKWAEAPLYNQIKPAEEMLLKFILTDDTRKKYFKISDIFSKSTTFVELWSWGVNKLLQCIKEYCGKTNISVKDFFQKKDNIKLVDINSSWFETLKTKIDEIAEKNVTEWLSTDFLKEIREKFIDESGSVYKNSKQVCYFIFGGTIGNFSIKEITWILENMKSKDLFKSSYVFVTYFTAPDKEKLSESWYIQAIQRIKAMYGDFYDINDVSKINPFANKETYEAKKNHILSWFKALGFDVSPEKLRYVVDYEEKKGDIPARIKLGVKLIEPQTIITPTGKIFTREAGECIWWLKSDRFTKQDFSNLVKTSLYKWNGYAIVDQQSDKDAWVSVAVLQSKLWIYKPLSITRKIVLPLLLTGSMLLSANILKDIQKESKIKKNNELHYKNQLKKIWITDRSSPIAASFVPRMDSFVVDMYNELEKKYGYNENWENTIDQSSVEEIKLFIKDFLMDRHIQAINNQSAPILTNENIEKLTDDFLETYYSMLSEKWFQFEKQTSWKK